MPCTVACLQSASVSRFEELRQDCAALWAGNRHPVLQAVLRRMQSEAGPQGLRGSSADMQALQDQLRSVAQETTALKRQSERLDNKLLRWGQHSFL